MNGESVSEYNSRADLVHTPPNSEMGDAKVDIVADYPPVNQDDEEQNGTYEDNELISIPDIGKVFLIAVFPLLVHSCSKCRKGSIFALCGHSPGRDS